ncbi:Uu.00g032800.m01.CDS01 [Anthostomella pinea]|uniref:Uu.00g032800.m01.CDS01 n=1 Tax=Anthostomella pinea TaxID=933095 RepID=A0AAI8V9D0_9PEZI|nr:Uu.00g032800.m01.CDS01 [Anthostomella pinea]
MTKVQKAKTDVPSRADSFNRMLELEKKCKTQIMKAVRRSSGLPSLSISVPPSPTQTLAVRTDGSDESLPPGKDERTKTVMFSDPEEDVDIDLSDESSICHSPSWEQYGQKKKKKPKKRETEQSRKEEDDKGPKKRNRLSKFQLQGIPGVKPLTATDRSISAPELELYSKHDKGSALASATALRDIMTNRQGAGKGLAHEVKAKPKSRGFLSSFRLQHGNVAAVQKIMETRTSVDDNQYQQNEHLEAPSMQKAPATNTGADLSFTNPRKPPSIRSDVSNSTPVTSSQDKRSSWARSSISSGHGRSQSLLSSTLNKLKGPSYLYYHPTEDTDGAQTRRPSSSHEVKPVHERHREIPPEKVTETPLKPHLNPIEQVPHQPEHTFSPKPRRATTEPGPEILPRGRQHRTHAVQLRDPSSDYEPPAILPSKERRTQIETPLASTRDSVMALVMAQEKQSRNERLSQHTRPDPDRMGQVDDLRSYRSRGHESGRKRANSSQSNDHTHLHAENRMEPQQKPVVVPSNQSQSTSSLNGDQIDRLDVNRRCTQEEDPISVGTHALTIRPLSRSQDRSSSCVTSMRHAAPTVSPELGNIGEAVTPEGSTEQAEAVQENNSYEDLITFDFETPTTIQQPLQPHRSADYFAFVSEAYAPPALELRSPLDGKFPSPRIPEEPEEEDADDAFFLNHPDHSMGTATVDPVAYHAVSHAVTSHPKTTGKPLYEQKSKNSPAISAHQSDSDVPAFERLGIPPKAAKVLAGVETASASVSQPHQTEPSRGTSERSSSSTYDDAYLSPSPTTTPDSSRPGSRKGLPPSQAGESPETPIGPIAHSEEWVSRQLYRQPSVDSPSNSVSRATSRDNRTANLIGLDHQPTPTFMRRDGLTSNPSLVATPTSVTFAEVSREDLNDELANIFPRRTPLPPRAQSALELHSPTKAQVPPALKKPSLHAKRTKDQISSVSLPNSPPPELADEVLPRKSALKMPRNNSANDQSSSALIAASAAHLQEARRAAPVPLLPNSRALRPHYAHKSSSGSVKSAVSGGRTEPIAKMLVECCNCKFFHDMPSRVYECMAKPDSVVEDKLLGVSAAITTMVKCPWCAHGMTTQCCSGYAAVVYLKEKLHGK